MHVLSETEALLELSESVDVERVIVSLAAIDMWIGQEVSVVVRRATAEEIQKSQKTVEDALNGNPGDAHGDARLFRMMEDIYRLAASPNGEALRIPNFSGTIPPPKNEATFTQWSYEVKEALDRFPENTVRNWILRSVRGSAADSIRSLGPRASVAAILHKLETMHGTVAPFDVMMRRLFNLVQGKTESVSTFATRLETAMANIQSNHPGRLTRASIEASMRDRFYQGLKKSYKEPLRYLYDAGSPYEAILIASRRVEAEMEHHKESEPAHAKAAQETDSGVWSELASIKVVVNKTWNAQQKQSKSGGNQKNDNQGKEPEQVLFLTRRMPAYGCGGIGHFIERVSQP